MIDALAVATGAALTGSALLCLAYVVSSVHEREARAAVLGFVQFLAAAAALTLFVWCWRSGLLRSPAGSTGLVVAFLAGVGGSVLLVRRSPPNPSALAGTAGRVRGAVERFDERDEVFARNRGLRPGSAEYAAYYREHPEHEAYDARRRERGGPTGVPGSIDHPHEGPNVAAAGAWGAMPLHLSAPEVVKPAPLPPFAGRRIRLSPEEATRRVKGHALSLGADMVGVAKLDPRWVYSHRGEIFRGNWEDWGTEITLDHPYAIVFATEMALPMIASSPHTPTAVETQAQYAKGAYLATMLAQFVANLGYAATANHLRYYDCLMVPLAVDAGLGELSRMGYLITRELGPRVRLGVITTDLPLVPDQPVDLGIEDFCGVCKKCADCCPSRSIPEGAQQVVNGTLRWKLDEESCFDYWGKVGTGCNVCMRVCPWSHARTLPHRIIRRMVARNAVARRLFTRMDDLFYGRKPKPRSGPAWARYRS